MTVRWRFTLRWRLWLLATLVAALATSLALLTQSLTGHSWLARAAGIVGGSLVGALLLDRLAAPALSLFRALAGTVTSYRDGDFGFDVAWPHDDELRDLVDAHNALGQVLREQHLTLVQRELLLDTMVQNTPVAMVLTAEAGRVLFANLAARQLLHRGRRMEGATLDSVLAGVAAPLADAVNGGRDSLVTVDSDEAADEAPVLHVSRKDFALNGRSHRLLMLRPLTRELRRQEVQTWKKVIRVVSHELNNSLAPIASLARSGQELCRRGRHDELPALLATVEERARHLESFIGSYAQVAKLPSPRLAPVAWTGFVHSLQAQVGFRIEGELPASTANLDAAQIAQALINLLKNAHESGSAADAVSLQVTRWPGNPAEWRLAVSDRGQGMSETVMSQALVPFYSTKRSGTGLGLALAREIAEAHGGRISLAGRRGGGLCVTLAIPA